MSSDSSSGFLDRLAESDPDIIERVVGRQLEAGASDDEIAGVLIAVTQTAGTPRVVAAAPHIAGALAG